MTISAKIVAAKAAIAEKKNELSALAAKAAEGEAVDAEVLDTLVKSIEEDEAKVASLEKAEQVLMSKSAPAFVKNKAAGEFSVEKSAIVTLVSKAQGISQLEAATKLYGEDSGTAAVIKAKSSPADQATAAWAGALTQNAYGEFLDVLRGVAVLPRVAAAGGMALNFDDNKTVIIPFNNGSGAVKASFIGQDGAGRALPVKASAFGQKTVSQSKMGVISTFSKEILTRSTPAVEAIVRNQIVQDTAEALDTLFLSATAATTYAPAGILAGIPAGNVTTLAASSFTDVVTGLKAAYNALTSAKMTPDVVVAHPSTIRQLSMLLNAMGNFAFASEIAAGRLQGARIIDSHYAPIGELIVIDPKQMAFGISAPEFTVNDTAALAMDATKPLELTSLFQEDLVALRNISYLAWADLRAGASAHLKGL